MDKIDWKLIDKLRHHNKNETNRHYIVKAMTFDILFKNNYRVYSEYEIVKNKILKVADIFAENKENKIVVEVETKPTKKHNKELMEFYKEETLYIIDVREISENLKEMEKQVKHILGM